MAGWNITNSTDEFVLNGLNASIFSTSFSFFDQINLSNETMFPNGEYNITVFAIDEVGNNRTSYNRFRVDRSYPNVTLVFRTTGSTQHCRRCSSTSLQTTTWTFI